MDATLDWTDRLGALGDRPVAERPSGLADANQAAQSAWSRGPDGLLHGVPSDVARKLEAMCLEVLAEGVGGGRERLAVGELLGLLGDPRLQSPDADDYWATVETDFGPVALGRFMVTNAEFLRFVADGGYDRTELWSEAGLNWLKECRDPWPVRSKAESSRPFMVPNQPVVGVTLYEAQAYARWAGGRLPRVDERVSAIRGRNKRPYPWGAPFGEGNANTAEEVLGRPCAVGLYSKDRTPEGVCDLAGNVAEWTADSLESGGDCLIHPGAWDQPSLAAWAKALHMEPADARWPGLGFRLAKDVS